MIDSQDIAGMPWKVRRLGNLEAEVDSYGLTFPTVSVKCECIECCDGWYIKDLVVDVNITIYIDTYRIIRDNGGWDFDPGPDGLSVEGVYGHEQRHARRMMAAAQQVFPAVFSLGQGQNRENFGAGADGRRRCESKCMDFRTSKARLFQDTIIGEGGHRLGQEPLVGIDYPPVGIMPRNPSNL